MLYKEWITVRPRVMIWLMVYGLLAFLLIFNTVTAQQEYYSYHTPLYRTWLSISLFITIVAALFGGADAVSDEMDKGTLSFLLTRPVTRKQIYTSKILMNVSGVVATFLPFSLIMFVVDQLRPNPILLSEGIGLTLLWTGIGATLICLGGLVSVFTHNVLQTVAFTIAIPTVVIALVAFGVMIFGKTGLNISLRVSDEVAMSFWIAVTAGLSAGLFWTGLKAFNRKQF